MIFCDVRRRRCYQVTFREEVVVQVVITVHVVIEISQSVIVISQSVVIISQSVVIIFQSVVIICIDPGILK